MKIVRNIKPIDEHTPPFAHYAYLGQEWNKRVNALDELTYYDHNFDKARESIQELKTYMADLKKDGLLTDSIRSIVNAEDYMKMYPNVEDFDIIDRWMRALDGPCWGNWHNYVDMTDPDPANWEKGWQKFLDDPEGYQKCVDTQYSDTPFL